MGCVNLLRFFSISLQVKHKEVSFNLSRQSLLVWVLIFFYGEWSVCFHCYKQRRLFRYSLGLSIQVWGVTRLSLQVTFNLSTLSFLVCGCLIYFYGEWSVCFHCSKQRPLFGYSLSLSIQVEVCRHVPCKSDRGKFWDPSLQAEVCPFRFSVGQTESGKFDSVSTSGGVSPGYVCRWKVRW